MTYRDEVMDKLAERSARANELGKNIDDLRKETRTTGGLLAQLTRGNNTPTPTAGHERLYAIDFATAVYNGTNVQFTVQREVLGENILLWHVVQASGSVTRLERTSNPAPSAGQFYFDGLFTVRVGTAPQALDALLGALIGTL
jgi:hypothetical protein